MSMTKLSLLRKTCALLCAALLAVALAGCASGQGAGSPDAADAPGTAAQDQAAGEADKPAKTEKQDKDAEALEQGMTCKYISSYFKTFGEALEQANQNGGGTVTLLADAPLSADGTVPKVGFRTTITVKSDGDAPFSIVRGDADAGPMLQITDGFVTLKNVVLDGTSAAALESPLVLVSDLGRLTLDEGAVLTGGNAASGASAVHVVGSDAYLTLEAGSEISQCTASGDAAAIVSEGGVVANNGATFSGNAGGSNPNYLETAPGTFEGAEIAA